MMSRHPRLAVDQVLTPEQAQEAKTQPGLFTTAQLHLLKQQIESLRRINVQLRAYRHKQRTGQDLRLNTQLVHVAAAAPISIPGNQPRAPFLKKGNAVKAACRRFKRERESLELDAATPSETVAADESASEGEFEVSDYETPEDSDVETAVAKVVAATLASPRRQSGRQRKAPPTLKEPSSGSESEGESEAEGHGQGAAAAGWKPHKGSSKPGSNPAAKSAGGGSTKQKRQAFVVVREETAGSGRSIVLPRMTPVAVQWAAGNDALCSVCGDGDDAEGNQVLLCEGPGCSVAVHQQCYGVGKVPKSKWLCDACKAKLSPSAPNCACCPVVGGALRKVVSLGRVVPVCKPERAYVHVACALWTPEMTLAEPEHMRGVQLDHMTALRAQLECALCKQAGGAVVQCNFSNCCRPFHVMCGRGAGQMLAFRVTDGYPMAFCTMHSGDRFERTRDALVEGKDVVQEEQEEQGMQGAGPPTPTEPPSEYELQRQRNIERNKLMLASIKGHA